MGPAHHARDGEQEARQRHAANQTDIELAVAGVGVGRESVAAPRRGAVAHLDHHHVPALGKTGRVHVEQRGAERGEGPEHRDKIGQEAPQVGHRVAGAHDGRAEPEPHAVHEPLVQHAPRVEALCGRRHQAGDGAGRIVAIDADELGEIVPRADRHHTQCGFGAHREEAVGHLVYGAVAPDGDDAPRAGLRRLRGQRHAMAGVLGARDVHRPPLSAQGAAHRLEGAE